MNNTRIVIDAGHGGYLYTLQNKTSIKPYNIMVFEFFNNF